MRKRAVLIEEVYDWWEKSREKIPEWESNQKLHHKKGEKLVGEQLRHFLFFQIFRVQRKAFFPSQTPQTIA